MDSIFFFVLFGTICLNTCAEEQKLPDHVSECYKDYFTSSKNNLIPHNMHSFIAILRKIELHRFDLTAADLSLMLLERFRQDGIVVNDCSFALNGFEQKKCKKVSDNFIKIIHEICYISKTMRGTTIQCSMHSMLSTTIDKTEREDRSLTCQTQSDLHRSAKSLYYRRGFSFLYDELTDQYSSDSDEEPTEASRCYSESKCPLVNGVISTQWGSITGGSVLAGIAAGLATNVPENTKWMATLAGDLAEVALRQGPKSSDYTDYTIGVEGYWDLSVSPKQYFINQNQDTMFTAAKIRGDLDGLILANVVYDWWKRMPSLRVSQIFDLYYSNIGIYNASMRACNRRKLLPIVAPRPNITIEVTRATEELYKDVQDIMPDSISESARRRYAMQAANKFLRFLRSMNSDATCDSDVNAKTFHHLATNLMIVVDTNWPYSSLMAILTVLLENSEISKYASSFTLINAINGKTIIERSNSILDFYMFDETQYSSQMKGFNLSKTIHIVQSIEMQRLDDESLFDVGGAPSSIAVMMPYTSASASENEKDNSLQNLKEMRQDVPDITILFLTTEPKDKWSNLTQDPTNDIVFVGNGSIEQDKDSIINLVNRIRRVPRRLINSQCSASWSAIGSSASYTAYLEPYGAQFYRLHPNYFYTYNDTDNVPTMKIKGSNSQSSFTVCYSRNPFHIDATAKQSNCTTIVNGENYEIRFLCEDYPHECHPVYLSIAANSSADSMELCIDPEHCRYPTMMKVTFSYENLRCVVGRPTPSENHSTNSPENPPTDSIILNLSDKLWGIINATISAGNPTADSPGNYSINPIHLNFTGKLWGILNGTVSGDFSMNLPRS